MFLDIAQHKTVILEKGKEWNEYKDHVGFLPGDISQTAVVEEESFIELKDGLVSGGYDGWNLQGRVTERKEPRERAQ